MLTAYAVRRGCYAAASGGIARAWYSKPKPFARVAAATRGVSTWSGELTVCGKREYLQWKAHVQCVFPIKRAQDYFIFWLSK